MIRAVLDTNQFIFGLRDEKEFCADIVKLSGIKFTALASTTILEEVFERLKELEGKDFASLAIHIIKNLGIEVIDDKLVPKEIIQKYKNKGAKDADSVIAAFTEFVNADFLVTENRHFLKEIKINEFKTIKAEDFMKVIKASK